VPTDSGLAAADRAELENQIAELTTKNQELALALETERGCRQQVIGSLSEFAAGPYDEVVSQFADEAKAILEARVAKRKRGEKLAIVLDVDETALSNLEQLRTSSYCFVRENWNEWVDIGEPTPLAGIRPLYDYAREHEVAVVFLSGRKQAQREDTERVLKAAGFEQWELLLLREPSEDELTAAEFKSGRRAKLEAEGYTVVLCVGDQQSDLDGGHAEHTVLIPNPFYHVK
jgi:acid phosphatase